MYKIIFENESILIIDKPQGLATATGKKENLCSILFKDIPDLSKVKGYKPEEGGLLNRLDNETGGLVLFAKTDEAFNFYSEEMKKGNIIKKYTAIVYGTPEINTGSINSDILHSKKNKKKMTVSSKRSRGNPQNALTEWKLIKKLKDRSMLEVTIKKGKRHQIRIHLASIGHPICGDKLYGKLRDDSFQHHRLYATEIIFKNYSDGKMLDIKIKADFEDLTLS